MKQTDKICIKIAIKSEKERDLYRKRQERYIEGTPKIILGKAQPNMQQIWVDDLKNEQIIKLKEYNNTQKAQSYAKTIVNTCCRIANHYGYFIINENMVFFNQLKEIFAWINPDVCENHVKIYLPHTHQGELAMIRSIITYLKLWFRCDYSLFTDVKHLNELSFKIEAMKQRPNEVLKPKTPQREFLTNRRKSVNMQNGEVVQRFQQEGKAHLLADNKSMKDFLGRSPNKQAESNYLTSSLSSKMSSPLKFTYLSSNNKQGLKNKTTLVSQKNGKDSGHSGNSEFEHRTFNNIDVGKNICLNKSAGIKAESSYYPNKTTANKNKKNHIVALINKHDTNPHQYGKNKILLDQYKLEAYEKERLRKGKECLDGIGEELNDLFLSNIQNQEENQDSLKKIEEQLSTLLQ